MPELSAGDDRMTVPDGIAGREDLQSVRIGRVSRARDKAVMAN